MHGTRRCSKLFFFFFFFFFFFSPHFLLFSAKHRGNESGARKARDPAIYLSSRNSARAKMCVSHACVSCAPLPGLHKSPTSPRCTGRKKGSGSGLGNFDKATCMSNWPRFIKLSPRTPLNFLQLRAFPLQWGGDQKKKKKRKKKKKKEKEFGQPSSYGRRPRENSPRAEFPLGDPSVECCL